MRPGRLDSQITIKSFTRTDSDDFGADEGNWDTVVAQPWAQASFLTGREGYELNAQTNETRIRFEIRYLADVTPAMRLDYEGEEYRIEAVDQTGRRRGVTRIFAARQTPAPA